MPWVEYIINYGWIGDSGIWAHVINRVQDKSAIIFLPTGAFIPLSVHHDDSMETDPVDQIQILYEWTSRYWISVR